MLHSHHRVLSPGIEGDCAWSLIQWLIASKAIANSNYVAFERPQHKGNRSSCLIGKSRGRAPLEAFVPSADHCGSLSSLEWQEELRPGCQVPPAKHQGQWWKGPVANPPVGKEAGSGHLLHVSQLSKCCPQPSSHLHCFEGRVVQGALLDDLVLFMSKAGLWGHS